MGIRHLQKIFRPQRVAVIGASNTAGAVGYTVFRNLIGPGFPGVVYPINPKYEAVQGVQAYASLSQVPRQVDLAIICTPAASVAGLIRECGEAGVLGVIVISAGFREAGPGGRELERQVLAEAAKFDGLRILGPNCLGAIVPGIPLNASFATATPLAGRVAFISQSGALCTSVLDWALAKNIGFSHFISIGNMLDVNIGDLIDYLAADVQTDALLLYVESITETRGFMSAARAFARKKPIVAYKAGRFPMSAQAAASHTGALAGVDAVYEAAFQRAGIERVFDVEDMFDCAELLARQPSPRGTRLAIVTNAGGPGVMATDTLIECRGELATLSPETMQKLQAALPAYWSHNNPVDILGDAPPERYGTAVETVLADPQVDALLVILTPQAMTNPTASAKAVIDKCRGTKKPVLTAWMGGPAVDTGRQLFSAAGIASYTSPEQGVRAFMHLVSYGRRREILYDTPRELPLDFAQDRMTLHSTAGQLLEQAMRESENGGRPQDGGPGSSAEHSPSPHSTLPHSTSPMTATSSDASRGKTGQTVMLSEWRAKELLSQYGIPVSLPSPAHSRDEAVEVAKQIGHPVVLKLHSPDISHKTDVGGVVLNLTGDDAVAEAYDQIVRRAREHRPQARILGVTVQKMITASKGFELILGAKRDPVFGSVILVGTGGVAAEVFQDRALELPPLNERLARRMLESLRAWPLLQGYRGRPGVDLERLLAVILRFSYMIADRPEIDELDINPLLVTPDEVIALDARVTVRRDQVGGARPSGPGRYAHLAIHPYPDEYRRDVRLKDGAQIHLRPIQPEDEPLWLDLLHRCSAQTLWFRFRYVFQHATHEMAARFCFIDYDREMAIVAETEIEGQRQLIGVGRLVADADHHNAEYAVLVADAWQSRGVGAAITDFTLEIARAWGIEVVEGETTPDNGPMLGLFRSRGFGLNNGVDPTLVVARKTLVSGAERTP